MNIKPNVKIGDKVLRRKTNGGEPDTWVETEVNETYLKLINEFPEDYRTIGGDTLELIVSPPNPEDVAKKIVEKLGEYVNGLDRRNLGMPMMDEVAVMQMEHIVQQILDDPSKEVDMPEYD